MAPDQPLTDDEREVLQHLQDYGTEIVHRMAYRNLLPAMDALAGKGLVVRLVALTDAGRAALESAPSVSAEDGARDGSEAR